MDISGATTMILGGSGLVGHSAARRLLACGPLATWIVRHGDEGERDKR